MKTAFKCEGSKKTRNYSNFSQKDFPLPLLNIGDGKNNYSEFQKNFVEALDKHAPKKTKIFRGNHNPNINKTQKSNYETFST